ncbi:hypothetical protein DL95DRAFT_406424 [Leptodontidium sp. 2 PMI_412]|nr:hypothetical protein DL95DRAFT_406424 [Leptodontidium sp. 2 PMI_412]
MSSRITRRGAPNSNTADSKVSIAKGGRRQARADGPLMCTNCRARKTRCDGTRPYNGTEVLLTEFSLDENGKLCYYGPTSAAHQPPDARSNASPSSEQVVTPSKARLRSLLASSAVDSGVWENFALESAALQNNIPKETTQKLLHIH